MPSAAAVVPSSAAFLPSGVEPFGPAGRPSRARTSDRLPAGPVLTTDLTAVAANTALFVRRAPAVMAVVKADGFGHGAADLARTALAVGAVAIGVTSLAEAFALRAAGVTAPLLSWLNPLDSDWEGAVRQRIDVAVPGVDHLDALTFAAWRLGIPARVHLHADVGLARDGAPPAAWGALAERARRAERGGVLHVVGVMGHLALADSGPDLPGRAAFARFARCVRRHGIRPVHRHLAATAATLTDPGSHHTMCRIGAGLVGIDPSGSSVPQGTLRGALRLTAPVVTVREVRAGTGVGYGHTWTAPTRTRLALLPLGYADGLPVAASGRAEVLLGGRRRPVVGRIAMDQVVVDVGDAPVAAGDVAVVYGAGDEGEPTVADWARWAGTLPHEIVTGTGPRVTRRSEPVVLRRVS